MKHISIQFYKSPMGEMILGSYEGKLCLADWRYREGRVRVDNRLQKALNASYVEKSSAIIEETKKQLHDYFSFKRKAFDIPLLLLGTDFQKVVWNGLLKVPYGETSSYLDLAKSIDKEKAVRAVSTAVGANAISILVPCHRIIGSNGTLTGYAGGLDAKRDLLVLEESL